MASATTIPAAQVDSARGATTARDLATPLIEVVASDELNAAQQSGVMAGGDQSYYYKVPLARRPICQCCWVCKWIAPTLVVLLSIALVLTGVSCSFKRYDWFDECPAVLIPAGVAFPLLAFVLVVFQSRPSKRVRLQQGFYSDALLEEMLSGENILETYSVTSPEGEINGTIVFLASIGSVPEAYRAQVDAVVEEGFRAITIQLPGAGCLGAVTFSMSRAERVVLTVLNHEVLNDSIHPTSHEDMGSFGNHTGTGEDTYEAMVEGEDEDDEAPGASSRNKVLLVASDLASHVAMHLASTRRLGSNSLVGIVLHGSTLTLKPIGWVKSFQYAAYRVTWIAETIKWSEYTFLDSDTKRMVSLDSLNPGSIADWADDFNSWCNELRVACSTFDGPVLCISPNKKYLNMMRTVWTKAVENNTLETVHISGLGRPGTASFRNKQINAQNRFLIDFANSIFPF